MPAGNGKGNSTRKMAAPTLLSMGNAVHHTRSRWKRSLVRLHLMDMLLGTIVIIGLVVILIISVGELSKTIQMTW